MNSKDDKLTVELDNTRKVEISVQTYQAIHKLVTGRPDKITKFYEEPLLIEIDELTQLTKKLHQACNQYKVIASSNSITVYHENDSKSELSSLDMYDRTINNPVESVLLKYNIVIVPQNVPAEMQHPQNYTISIRLVSRLVVMNELKKIRKKIINGETMIANVYSAKVDIEYVDYLIAKTINHVIDDCIKGFKLVPTPRLLNIAIKNIAFIRLFLKYFIFLAFLMILMIYVPSYITHVNNTLSGLSKFIMYGFTILFFSYKLGDYFSLRTRVLLSDLGNISLIKFNKGDEKIINEYKSEERSALFKVSEKFVIEIIIAVAANIIGIFIFK